MFTDRINFMNMAFYKVSRQVGTFSNDAKNIIDYLHKKYYDYYNCMTECFFEQNKKSKCKFLLLRIDSSKPSPITKKNSLNPKRKTKKKPKKLLLTFRNASKWRKNSIRKTKKSNTIYRRLKKIPNLSNKPLSRSSHFSWLWVKKISMRWLFLWIRFRRTANTFKARS